jgi:hypothetical protein
MEKWNEDLLPFMTRKHSLNTTGQSVDNDANVQNLLKDESKAYFHTESLSQWKTMPKLVGEAIDNSENVSSRTSLAKTKQKYKLKKDMAELLKVIKNTNTVLGIKGASVSFSQNDKDKSDGIRQEKKVKMNFENKDIEKMK